MLNKEQRNKFKVLYCKDDVHINPSAEIVDQYADICYFGRIYRVESVCAYQFERDKLQGRVRALKYYYNEGGE
ncbi:hypothetical protein DRH14_03615 [Candidatus Shapirobacteria bacterium]|nr:MAG: hypothetical protein DRH14_03615 [Candidatus Shapirobacteria bacterium]RLG44005.1 MAG: hypothetical protein DRN81_05445 [Candidatus Korarchaeota archaeon]